MRITTVYYTSDNDKLIRRKTLKGDWNGNRNMANEYVTALPRTVLLDDRNIITIKWTDVCKTDKPLFRLYIPPASISPDELSLELMKQGFIEVGLSVHKEEKYSLRKLMHEPWELHLRIFDDGFIEAEVEIKREYLEHLEPRRSVVVYEAYQAYAHIYPSLHILHTSTGKWITNILEHYQVRISPPRTLTPWKPIVAVASLIGTIGLVAFALSKLDKPKEK